MKIQIITMAMSNREHRKFYNAQDIGLGKALCELGHDVEIFNFIKSEKNQKEVVSERLCINYLFCKSLGTHSLHAMDFIREDVDAVICFSDNQINLKKVVKVCRQKNVICLPYIGVIDSHNNNKMKQVLLDILIQNKKLYKDMKVLTKTPNVKEQLKEAGICDSIVASVCLDLDAVNKEYLRAEIGKIREELGYTDKHKVLLFLARMTEEKHPLEMLDIFYELYQQDESYRLLSIGKGELLEEYRDKIKKLGLEHVVNHFESVENNIVWQYYCAADTMINLNRVEIFGMAILEAMYYECPVIARRAPGPEYIITDGVDGYLCDDSEMIVNKVKALLNDEEFCTQVGKKAHERIQEHFLWKSTAHIIEQVIMQTQKEMSKIE